ncbi:MAG TPA: poly-gamma-glutamate synthase PgsB [Candidatus Krumholzibacteria bacterium]|nr:poly-gamma-glutamate synthase PgsB [Candidatus Krumholzibacteria bacterium]
MRLIILLLVLLTVLGVWEQQRHARTRRRIPVRVHVNGSRGKSSVARLIGAGLRAGGLRVVAKTTGSAAALVHVDGSESPIRRRGGPNIREQLAVMRAAVAERCDALVLECMAVRPDLQRVCEHGIVHATHGVITNVRPDHLEVMGPTMDDVAASLGGTVPRKAGFFTAELAYADYLGRRAGKLGTTCTVCRAEDVTAQEMAGFRYVEFADNVALALAVCQDAGVDRRTALEGMWDVTPDVGALTRWRCVEDGKHVEFINAFAANDPVSYIRIWERLGLDAEPGRVVLLMNVRGDRQRRSKDLAPLLGRELPAAHYALIGEETAVFGDLLRRQGYPSRSLVADLSRLPEDALWRALVALAPDGGAVVGVGNIAGIGNRLLDHVRARRLPA